MAISRSLADFLPYTLHQYEFLTHSAEWVRVTQRCYEFVLLSAPTSSWYIRALQFLILYQDTFRSSTYASHRSFPSNLNNFSQLIWCGLKSSRAEISRVILYFESCAWRYATDMENSSWMCYWSQYKTSVELRQVFIRFLINFVRLCGFIHRPPWQILEVLIAWTPRSQVLRSFTS